MIFLVVANERDRVQHEKLNRLILLLLWSLCRIGIQDVNDWKVVCKVVTVHDIIVRF